MFFIIGVNPEERKLDFGQMCTCKACGRMGRYEVYRVCTVLTLFFLPLLRWGKRYEVRETSCGARCALDGEIGRRIERGEAVTLADADLPFAARPARRRCPRCCYETGENFAYCPMCGSQMVQ